VIWVNFRDSPKDRPLESIFFRRGTNEMVFRIVRELAKVCGPFVVAISQEEWHLVTQ